MTAQSNRNMTAQSKIYGLESNRKPAPNSFHSATEEIREDPNRSKSVSPSGQAVATFVELFRFVVSTFCWFLLRSEPTHVRYFVQTRRCTCVQNCHILWPHLQNCMCYLRSELSTFSVHVFICVVLLAFRTATFPGPMLRIVCLSTVRAATFSSHIFRYVVLSAFRSAQVPDDLSDLKLHSPEKQASNTSP